MNCGHGSDDPVQFNHLVRGQFLEGILECREGKGRFGIQPVEGFFFGLPFVIPNQVADVFADVLVRAPPPTLVETRSLEACGNRGRLTWNPPSNMY